MIIDMTIEDNDDESVILCPPCEPGQESKECVATHLFYVQDDDDFLVVVMVNMLFWLMMVELMMLRHYDYESNLNI